MAIHSLTKRAYWLGLLANPSNPVAELDKNEMLEAAQSLGQRIHIVPATSERDFEAAFAALVHERAGALIVNPDAIFTSGRSQLVALAARHAIPTMYFLREFAQTGGLIGYGTNVTDAHRQAGVYTGQVLKGAKPADLPVLQSTKFELVINLNTARALGLELPPMLLARADEGSNSGRRQAKLARSAGASPAQVRPSEPPGSECCVRRR